MCVFENTNVLNVSQQLKTGLYYVPSALNSKVIDDSIVLASSNVGTFHPPYANKKCMLLFFCGLVKEDKINSINILLTDLDTHQEQLVPFA